MIGRQRLSLVEQEDRERIFAERLGGRLRTVRRRQRLSLQAVERLSNQEFRASVLGAYERGERAISVVRLQRLARFYNVPVGRLVMGEADAGQSPQPAAPVDPGTVPARGKLSINLAQLAHADFPGKALLSSYVLSVQTQRKDFDSQVISLREADGRIIAQMLSLTLDQLRQQLLEHRIIT